MTKLVLALICLCLAGAAPSTQPTTQAAFDAMLAYQRAESDPSDAIKSLQAIAKTLPREDRDSIAKCNLALAVAYWNAGQRPRAREAIDRAYTSSKDDPYIRVSRAIVDLKDKSTVVRGVRELALILEPANAVDESLLNLFGYGIVELSKVSSASGDVKRYSEVYQAVNTRLEATKPGQKRFGSKWLDVRAYQESVDPPGLANQRDQSKSAVEREVDSLSRAQERLREARAEAISNPQNRSAQSSVRYAQQEVNEAQRSLQRAQQELQKVINQFPRPTFEVVWKLRTPLSPASSTAKPTPPAGMYDAAATPRNGDTAIALHGSSLRPEDPVAAYESIAKGWTVEEVLTVLGGYQEESETDEIREIRWRFLIDNGPRSRAARLDIVVQFKEGKVASKSKNTR